MSVLYVMITAGLVVGLQPANISTTDQPESGAVGSSSGHSAQNAQDRLGAHIADHGHYDDPFQLESDGVFVQRVLYQLLAVRYWVGLAQGDPDDSQCITRLRCARNALASLMSEQVLSRLEGLKADNSEQMRPLLFLLQLQSALLTTYVPDSCALTDADLVRIGAQFETPPVAWTPIDTGEESDDTEKETDDRILRWPDVVTISSAEGGVGGGSSDAERILAELQRTLDFSEKLHILRRDASELKDPLLLWQPGSGFQVLEERGAGQLFDVTPSDWQPRSAPDQLGNIVVLEDVLRSRRDLREYINRASSEE